MNGDTSLLQSLRALLCIVPKSEKKRFFSLLLLSALMALCELLIAGLVSLLAMVFGSPKTIHSYNPMLWIRQHANFTFWEDVRLFALAVLVFVFIAIALKNILLIIQQWNISSFSESIGKVAKERVFRFYLRAPYMWIMRTGVSDLRFGLHASNQLSLSVLAALQIFANVLLMGGLLAGLMAVSPVTSLMLLGVLGGGGAVIMKTIRVSLDRLSQASFGADSTVHKITHLALHGLKEMRLYGRDAELLASYENGLSAYRRAKVHAQTWQRVPVACLESLGVGSLLCVMLYLLFVQHLDIHRISGIVGFVAAAAWRGLPVASRLVDSIVVMRQGGPYLHAVAQLLELEKTMEPSLLYSQVADKSSVSYQSSIVFDKVTFQYPGATAPAIRDVSLVMPKGTTIGIVGVSGSGKSTLVNLLTGLLQPNSGSVRIDGVPLCRENFSTWLQYVGYVAQAPYIFDASLAENIGLVCWGEDVDRERVLECCRMASLDFVDDLEDGIDTILGDRGTRLSGGQAQRVAIARALYASPELIIFDEATSALDMKNEKAIIETILSLRSQVTMIIIAHRLTTVEGCDHVIWLDKGSVRAAGESVAVLAEYRESLHAAEQIEYCDR
ncbi:ABC transporter ATP-binding protein [Nitratidesulfovibrio termitidis]|uniref:ABC transporter ATP-binding protein n=1 Tax=Nitratidesulfovibrio termitidis TaxID=42252 RepID=UPI000686899F|nr:ABC transporter ATP-binding protein [Nitratidesulfovibrio termitidis]